MKLEHCFLLSMLSARIAQVCILVACNFFKKLEIFSDTKADDIPHMHSHKPALTPRAAHPTGPATMRTAIEAAEGAIAAVAT